MVETLKTLGNMLYKLNEKMSPVLRAVDYDSTQVPYGNMENPDDLFKREEYQYIIGLLEVVHDRLEYLNKPISAEGTLRKNSGGRYEIDDYTEFTSGNGIEFLKWDTYEECNKWIRARIEHTDGDYYIYGHKDIVLEGLQVRTRR